MTSEHQERAHAIRSPSSAHGWRRCKGRINAEKGRPDRVGVEAAEGTLFHEHAELCLVLGLDPEDFKTGVDNKVDGHTVSYNQEMIDHLTKGLDFIYSKLAEYRMDTGEEALLFVENRVRIEPWTMEPNGFGTSDVCMVFPLWRLIIVFDWKYGKIVVSPIRNDQLTLYGLGCWGDIAHKFFEGVDPADIRVEYIIWQPRVPGGGGSWGETVAEMLAEGELIRLDAEQTYDPDAPRTAGPKQCMYCKASGDCTTLADYNLKQFGIRFDDIDDAVELDIELADPDFAEWSLERRAYVLLHKAAFERWFKKLHEGAMLAAAQGSPWPMTKMIMGPDGNRAWKKGEEEEVEGLLVSLLAESKRKSKPEAVTRKLMTPAKAQEVLGKKIYENHLKPYVTRSPGKPMMAPETDPRPALPTFGQEFDEAMLLDDEEQTGETE